MFQKKLSELIRSDLGLKSVGEDYFEVTSKEKQNRFKDFIYEKYQNRSVWNNVKYIKPILDVTRTSIKSIMLKNNLSGL